MEYMMNITDDFNEKKYVVLKDVLDQDYCALAVDHLFKLFNNNEMMKDEQCPLSDSIYGDAFFDNLLEKLTPFFSEISGKKLYPTYSYARIYRKGDELKIHRDRPSCEFSATINLNFKDQNWPIFFSKENTNINSVKLVLNVGDAIFYKGCELYHWREQFKGEWCCQVFFHYVDSEGAFKDQKFDGRLTLGTKKCIEPIKESFQDFIYWSFDNVLSSDFCDQVIQKYNCYEFEKGKVGGNRKSLLDPSDGIENISVRNVDKTILPLEQEISAHLIGNAFIANQQAWRFNINKCEQVEYLRYSETGRYKSHIDTIFSNNRKILDRKLTAIAFLNDDYDGGKFFLQITDQRCFPNQTKGTIIVFPSFFLHGVEDVIRGQRHAVVAWLLGPKFK